MSPQLIEEDILKIIVPLTPQATVQVTEQATVQATEQAEREKKILKFCKTGKSAKEIMDFLGLRHREHFRADILNPMLDKGLLLLSIPDTPTSPKQRYYSVKPEDAKK